MTVGTLRGYGRYAVRGQGEPALVPSPEPSAKVKGMVIFSLSESQCRIIDMYDPFSIATVEITLEDSTIMQLNAGIYVWRISLEVLPVEEKKWPLSEFIQSEMFKQIGESTIDKERILEFGTQEDQIALTDCVREMGFIEMFFDLPKSLLMAISNRFTEDQTLKRNWNSEYYCPLFFGGTSIFPAYVLSRTPGLIFESVAQLMTPGILRRYNSHTIRGRDFQALYPSENPEDKVTGIVYFGIHTLPEGPYGHRKATVEIKLADGTKLDLKAITLVWNGKKEGVIPLEDEIWSPSSFLNSAFYKLVATKSEAAENRLAFDQAFRNFQLFDNMGEMLEL